MSSVKVTIEAGTREAAFVKAVYVNGQSIPRALRLSFDSKTRRGWVDHYAYDDLGMLVRDGDEAKVLRTEGRVWVMYK